MTDEKDAQLPKIRMPYVVVALDEYDIDRANHETYFIGLIESPDFDINSSVSINSSLSHPNVTPVDESEPLIFIAMRQGYERLFSACMNHPKIDINLKTRGDCTALIVACALLDSAMVSRILSHPDVDPNIRIKNHQFPALYICMMSRAVKCFLLVAAHPKTDRAAMFQLSTKTTNTTNYLGFALAMKWEPAVSFFLATDEIDVNLHHGTNSSHLVMATTDDQSDKLARLLYHPRIKVAGDYALFYACQNNAPGCTRMILEHPQCDINLPIHDGQTPLSVCMELGNVEALRVLFQYGREMNLDAIGTHIKRDRCLANPTGGDDWKAFLLTFPADQNIISVLEIAEKKGHEECVALYKAYIGAV